MNARWGITAGKGELKMGKPWLNSPRVGQICSSFENVQALWDFARAKKTAVYLKLLVSNRTINIVTEN